MEKFVELFYKNQKDTFMSDVIELDQVPGYFMITLNKICFTWTDINAINCKRKIELSFHNMDTFKTCLVKALNLRFWKDKPFFNEQEYLLQESFFKMVHEIKNKEEQRNQLFELMIEEAEGRSATLKVGKGSVYKEKKAE